MLPSLEQIRLDLTGFRDEWLVYNGTEKAASQTFLNRLVEIYTGHPNALKAGANFEEFGDTDQGTGYMDLFWEGVCIIEMKRPSESQRLYRHRNQALGYWKNSSDFETGREAPPFLVLCSFREFEIWKPGAFPDQPVDRFSIDELPEKAESLQFLAGRVPRFGGDGPEVTSSTAQMMVELYRSLIKEGEKEEDAHHFIMQVVWELFSEDLGLIEGRPLENLAIDLRKDPMRTSSTAIHDLFSRLNIADSRERNLGLKTPLPYVNGDLFSKNHRIHLNHQQLDLVVQASKHDWRAVDPTIFGTLLEGCLGPEKRLQLGSHFTSEVDILSVIGPTIVSPWVDRIEEFESVREGLKLYEEFLKFKVLDPAMGAGNFLAVAFKQLRQLERRFRIRLEELARSSGAILPFDLGFFSLENLYGIEIHPASAELARLTLWLTHAKEARTESLGEAILPLPALKNNLVVGDALKMQWPTVDAIVGNPPYHGSKKLRSRLGEQEVEWLKAEFEVGVKDYCVYFLRKAHEHLAVGQRAGLVLTNSVSSGYNKDAGTRWVLENDGVFHNVLSNRDWSGEAEVVVSILNWVKDAGYEGRRLLDGKEVGFIGPDLRESHSSQEPQKLTQNSNIFFIGTNVGQHDGFIIDEVTRLNLLADSSVDYSQVLSPWLDGDELYELPIIHPSRSIIDFHQMNLEDAMAFPRALDILRKKVRPIREETYPEGSKDRRYADRWWNYIRDGRQLRKASEKLNYAMALVIHTQEFHVVKIDPSWRVNHGIGVFASDNDALFGILLSSVHQTWARRRASSLGSSPRYSSNKVFKTFPLPASDAPSLGKIAEIAREIDVLRVGLMKRHNLGVRKLYQLAEQGGFNNLLELHNDLNQLTLDAYGLDTGLKPHSLELFESVLKLNLAGGGSGSSGWNIRS